MQNGLGVGAAGEPMYTLDRTSQHAVYPALSVRDAKGPSSNADQAPPIITSLGVRRLMPLEWERLQGFPDGWTEGRADGHRYRMMGNAVAVPVLEWIARRLVAVDAML